MAKKSSAKKTKDIASKTETTDTMQATGLSAKQIHERAEAHPLAVPFLWLGKEKTIKNFIYVPFFGLILFSILGYFFPLHHPAPWDIFFGSYAIIGFVAYSFVVISAWPLFKLLARDENYYGETLEEEKQND